MTALPIQLRPGRPDDALAILAAHRSAIRQTAPSAYSPAIIDEWAPAVIVPERVDTFQRWIERGEELIVVAVDSAGEIIGFGSIVLTNSELRAVYVGAAYGGQGVGRALLARLEDLARKAGLTELRMDASINAVPFYEANGFISLEKSAITWLIDKCRARRAQQLRKLLDVLHRDVERSSVTGLRDRKLQGN
jgi:putative acetyltransferase